MPWVPDDVLEDIKQKVSLPDLLRGAGVKLQRVGRDSRGRCPFEPGSTNASKFVVKPTSYFCYGCDAKGDVITWLREHEGLTFREAVERAAALAGVSLAAYQQPDRTARPVDPARAALDGLLATLAQWATEEAQALSAEAQQFADLPVQTFVA